MIIQREPRWCVACNTTQVHDVYLKLTPAGRKREHCAVCLKCARRTEPQRISRAELQNGGLGDCKYRTRRARL